MATLGRYELIETLGQGGMGTIHLAVVGGLGRFRKLVVLKVLRDELTHDPKFVEMFMREATIAACLSHPNVVQTVEAGHADGRYFLVMEFLDGQPYSRLLRNAARDPVLPLALRLHVLCEALLGLHYAHELCGYDGRALSLVHRDVSPPNVFVSYDGQVKLLDFGIADAHDSEDSHPGEFRGKLGYAAPEQLRGVPADRRIDVFAAGVVLWESIALRQLAQGTPTREVFAARLAGTEPRIGEVVPGLDPVLAKICDRAMHTEPEARYATAEEFRSALYTYLTDRELVVDGNAVSQYMHAKFAGVRAAMHRRIDAHSKEGPAPDSLLSLEALAGQLTPAAAPYVHRFSSLSPARDGFSPSSTFGSPYVQQPSRTAYESPSGQVEALIQRAAQERRARRITVRRVAVIIGSALFIAGAAWLARGSRHQATAASLERSVSEAAPGPGAREDAGPPSSSAAAPPVEAVRPAPRAVPGDVQAPASLARARRTRSRERSESEGEGAGNERKTVRSGDTARTRSDLASSSDARARDAATPSSDKDVTDLRRVQKRERRQLDLDNPFK